MACTSCMSASVCMICLNGWGIVGGKCKCMSEYYAAGTMAAPTCVACNTSVSLSGCLECSSATDCVTCNLVNHWVLAGMNCICDKGYYQVGTGQTAVCNACGMDGCVECSSSTVCLACDQTTNWILSGNQCVCSSGFYLVHSALTYCQPCNIKGCLSCSSATTCLACDTSSHWQLLKGQCTCPPNFTPNPKSP